MVLKTMSVNRVVAAESTTSGCLICLSVYSQDTTFNENPKLPEILAKLFQVLCKYMKWSPPSKYQFDFHTESFPFCKNCRPSIVRLHRFSQLLSELQKQIDQVSLKLTATILESQNQNRKNLELKVRLDSSQNGCEPKKFDGLRSSEKFSYYRDTICKRYSSSVRILCEPLLFSKHGEINAFGTYNKTIGTVPENLPSTNSEIYSTKVSNNVGKLLEKDVTHKVQDGYCGTSNQSGNEEFVSSMDQIPSHGYGSGHSPKISEFGNASEKESNDAESFNDTDMSSAPDFWTPNTGLGDQKGNLLNKEGDKQPLQPEDDPGESIDAPNILIESSSSIETTKKKPVTKETDVSETLILKHCRRETSTKKMPVEPNPERLTETSEESQDDCSDYEPSLASQSEAQDQLDEENDSEEDTKFVPQDIQPSVYAMGSYFGPTKIRIAVIRTENYLRPEKDGDIREEMLKDHDDVEDKDVEPEKGPFPSLRGRLKKVGDFLYLLDDKCLFEFTGKTYKCISCDLNYQGKNGLKLHLNSCPGNASNDVVESYRYRNLVYDKLQTGELRCRLCQSLCSSYDAITCHMDKVHRGKRRYKYRIKPWYVQLEPNKYLCNQKYPFELKEDNFECGTCLANFSTRSEAVSHIHRVHIVPEVKLKVVYKNPSPNLFVWTDPLNKTFSFEKVENQYKCGQCSYNTSRERGMKEHIKYKHIEITSVSSVCETCGKQFPAKCGLREHMKTHNNTISCTCELCGRAFKTPGTLAVHQKNFHAEICDEKFTCNVCGRFFGSMTLLRIHAGTHEVIVCDVCGKEVTRSALPGHVLSHNDNSFKCFRCGKKYRYGFGLKVHMQSCGEADKPYSCDLCGMKFTQSYSVTRHKNVVHKSKIPRKRCVQSLKRKREETCSDTNESELDEDV